MRKNSPLQLEKNETMLIDDIPICLVVIEQEA